MKKILTLFLLFAITQVYAQEKSDELLNGWKIDGFAHIIGQMDGKDFSNETHPLFNTSMKFRLGAEKKFLDRVKFRIDVQDSRLIGSGFVADNKNLDLFQGYIEYMNILDMPLSLQAGRFQMQYGTERYIGRSLWHYVERAFDGFRLKYKTDNFSADYFHIIHTNDTPYLLKVSPSLYSYPAEPDEAWTMHGIWTHANLTPDHNIDVFGYLENNRKKSNGEDPDLERYTAGLNYNGNFGKFSTILEAAYQFGTAGEKDIAAYFTSAKFNYKLGAAKLTAGLDMVSGKDPKADNSDVNVFSNYPASKHKFLGLMDYFLLTGPGTGNLGVNDFYLGASLGNMVIGKPASGQMNDLNVMLMGHYFLANQENSNGDSDFGAEIDLVLKYNITKSVFVQTGGGVFTPGEAMKAVWKTQDGTVREDLAFWTFVMMFVKI